MSIKSSQLPDEIFKHPILAALCSIRINGNLILYVNREDAERRLK